MTARQLMMLCYKSWRESKARFLIAASVVSGLCVILVAFEPALHARFHARIAVNTYAGYIYQFTYGGSVRGLFSILAPILGLGGIQRERAQHTDGFTLALPVSRRQLLTARAAVGMVEIAVLSLLPALVICGLSPLVNLAYPWSQALQFSVLWTVVGVSGFAAWLLASVIFSGDYTALTVCWIVGFFTTLVTQRPSIRPLHLNGNYIMSGRDMPYFNPKTDLLIGPFPWGILLVTVTITLCVIALAVRITSTQDFA
jgi:ABC-type transport system involved in multi-copper enzyme maturation permease subunit